MRTQQRRQTVNVKNQAIMAAVHLVLPQLIMTLKKGKAEPPLCQRSKLLVGQALDAPHRGQVAGASMLRRNTCRVALVRVTEGRMVLWRLPCPKHKCPRRVAHRTTGALGQKERPNQ